MRRAGGRAGRALASASVAPITEDAAPEEVPAAAALVRRVIGLLVFVAVLALVVSVLPGLQEVRARFHSAEPGWLAATFACVFASTLSYVAAVRGTLSRRPGGARAGTSGWPKQGSNAPAPANCGGIGGPALGALVMRRAGVPSEVATPRSGALFLLTERASFVAIAPAGIVGGPGCSGGRHGLGRARGCRRRSGIAAMAAVAGWGACRSGSRARAAPRRALGERIGAPLRDGVQESLALLRPAIRSSSAAVPAISASRSPPSARPSRPSAAKARRSPPSSWPTRSGRWARCSRRPAARGQPRAG